MYRMNINISGFQLYLLQGYRSLECAMLAVYSGTHNQSKHNDLSSCD